MYMVCVCVCVCVCAGIWRLESSVVTVNQSLVQSMPVTSACHWWVMNLCGWYESAVSYQNSYNNSHNSCLAHIVTYDSKSRTGYGEECQKSWHASVTTWTLWVTMHRNIRHNVDPINLLHLHHHRHPDIDLSKFHSYSLNHCQHTQRSMSIFSQPLRILQSALCPIFLCSILF